MKTQKWNIGLAKKFVHEIFGQPTVFDGMVAVKFCYKELLGKGFWDSVFQLDKSNKIFNF